MPATYADKLAIRHGTGSLGRRVKNSDPVPCLLAMRLRDFKQSVKTESRLN